MKGWSGLVGKIEMSGGGVGWGKLCVQMFRVGVEREGDL